MKKLVSILILAVFVFGNLLPQGYCQGLILPEVTQRVEVTPVFQPTILRAVAVDMNNPLKFDFYVDEGQEVYPREEKREVFRQLIKDFLTALTIPESDLWVNLSPYEQGRMIEDRLGRTEMGRDLLAQDYILKQLMASLLYPEKEPGRTFWAEVYRKAYETYGTTDIPVDTFNKVWIMPDEATVYQEGSTAVVLGGHLKVMLESDYMAMENNLVGARYAVPAEDGVIRAQRAVPVRETVATQEMAKAIIRNIVLPAIEKEVNEGQNFARLRQIYHALILAAWYKKNLRETFLGKSYADKSKVEGVDQKDPTENQRIYERYVEAFKVGAYNYIKDDIDRYTGEAIPRKYFSGGFSVADFSQRVLRVVTDASQGDVKKTKRGGTSRIGVELVPRKYADNIPTTIGDGQGRGDEEKMIEELAQRRLSIRPDPLKPLYGRQQEEFIKADRELRKLVKERIKQVIGKERIGPDLLRLFNRMIDDENETGFQSLALSGTYTRDVFRHVKALAMLARKSTPVPYDDIFDILELRPELRQDFLRIAQKLNTVEDFEAFARMVQQSPASTMKGSLFLIGNEFQGKKILNEKRQGDWNKFVPPDIRDDQLGFWAKNLVVQADAFLLEAKAYLEELSKITPETTDDLVFVRSKRSERAVDKLQRLRKKGSSIVEIYDLLAGRIAVRGGLAELALTVKNIIKSSIAMDKYIRQLEIQKYHLEKMQAESPSDKRAQDLVRIQSALENFDYSYPLFKGARRHILVEVDNRFRGDGWYKAVHMDFMIGNGYWTVESQIKTLRRAIMDDFEHLFYEDEALKGSDLHKDVLKYLWLMNAVEMANYFYTLDKDYTKIMLETYLPDKAQASAGMVKVQDGAMTPVGGIDVRGVEGRLNVQGRSSALAPAALTFDMPDQDVGGYTPIIVSIMENSLLPVLNARK